MIDPIAAGLRWYFGLFSIHTPGALIVQFGLITMLVCTFIPNMMRARQRARERQVARLAINAIDRIRDLIPEYRATSLLWCRRVELAVDPLWKVSQQIPDDVKIKAERDFCMLDANRPEAVALLQMQVNGLLHKQNENSTTNNDQGGN
jgi:hypothetical protein